MYLPNGLTDKEEMFIRAYLGEYGKDCLFNATQSVKFVYNTEDDNTAGVMGYELLRKPKNIEFMNELKRKKVENLTEIDIANEIYELKEIALREGKLSEAQKSLELLGKWKAMFTDKQITQSETLEDILSKLNSLPQNETTAKSQNENDASKQEKVQKDAKNSV